MDSHKVVDHIINWLLEFNKDFVIGVSDGIDSSVVSTLCAMTGRKVIAMSLPIIDIGSKNHLKWLVKRFDNVDPKEIDLGRSFRSWLSAVNPHFIFETELTIANAMSRMRMMTLYAFANYHGMIVAGTGNKVEDFGVGFFTKYGDGAVDCSPIADLMKTEVREIAKYLELPNDIIYATPTDGLWADGRSDEDQIGATYAELEWAMHFDKNPAILGESKLSERQKEVYAIYRKRHEDNLHKMRPIPVCKIPKEYL